MLQGSAGAFSGLAFVFRVNPHTMAAELLLQQTQRGGWNVPKASMDKPGDDGQGYAIGVRPITAPTRWSRKSVAGTLRVAQRTMTGDCAMNRLLTRCGVSLVAVHCRSSGC